MILQMKKRSTHTSGCFMYAHVIVCIVTECAHTAIVSALPLTNKQKHTLSVPSPRTVPLINKPNLPDAVDRIS